MIAALRNIGALVALTALAGAALAWFADFTEEDVHRNRVAAETRVFRELGRVDFVTLGDGDLVLCDHGLVVLRVAGRGYGGEFRLAVALGLDGSVTGVRVLEHAETPGFSDILAADAPWLESFTTGDVHAVSGATVTSAAVMAAVGRAVERVRQGGMCP